MINQTHYIPAFTARNGHDQQAACGRWVRATEHTAEPSCPNCRAYLEQDAEDDTKTAEEMFGPSDSSQTVKPTFAENCDRQMQGYRPRGAR